MEGQHFLVGNKKFNNYFAAIRESKWTGKFAYGVIPQWHIDAWSTVDVEATMQKPIEHWIDQKLCWLADTYKVKRLHYSGGTDSQTLLVRAMKLGIKFESVWTYLRAMSSDTVPWVDEEVGLGLEFLEKNRHAFKERELTYCTEQMYENWLDPEYPYSQPGLHMGFGISERDIIMQSCTVDADCEVTGQAKPILFRKNDTWYMVWLTGNDQPAHLKGIQYFYSDGYIPEVAVSQAYHTKNWIEKNLPKKDGWYSEIKFLSSDMVADFNYVIGREPALSKNILLGKYGKGRPHNDKHARCIKMLIDHGRWDIVEGYFDRCKEVKENLESVEYGLEFQEIKKTMYPANDTRSTETIYIPNFIDRIPAVMRMDDECLVQVKHDGLF